MADEDMDIATDCDKEVSNHMDTDDKGRNHGNDRTTEHELAENAVRHIGPGDKLGSKDSGEMGENCTENSTILPEVSDRHTEGGGTTDGASLDKNSTKLDKMATGESGKKPEGKATEDATAVDGQQSNTDAATAGENPGKSTEGGETEGGMATDDAKNASKKNLCKSLKLLDSLRAESFLKDRKSRPSRRSYRLRNKESGEGDRSDSSDEDERRGTDSSTRSQRSRSDSSETESDMEREGNEERGSDAADAENKTSGAELCSDLEDELLAKQLPNPSWRAIPMLRARQIGAPKEQLSFCYKAIGSAHMVSRFEKYCELKHHEGCVNTLHFNQSGKLLASGSDDLSIVLWDWARQKTVLVYPSGHRSNVFQAKFMPFSGDTTLVSCARDGQVRVGELSSTGICKGTKKLVQHKGAAHKLGLEPDSPVVFLSCGEDAAVYNIDLRGSKATKLVTVKEEVRKVPLYTIFLNPMNTDEFCVGGRDHFVRIYDRRKVTDEREGLVKKFCPHHLMGSETRANVTCCVYSYNGREILASYNDEDIYLFDSTHSDGAESVHCYKGHRNNQTVKGVNFYGPQSQFVVSGSDCGNIFLWEKNTEKIVQYMKGDVQGVVNCLESHPSSAVLATSGLDHDVKIWMPTSAEPTQLEGLKQTMYSNRREREEERSREPDMIDGHMLMFLMHHLRRRARRQAREAGEMDSDSSSSDSDSSEDDEEGLPHERSQCAPS
ncbi:DDB1- and CUL4-associated factor 8-like [Acanthaster planci]|uniref:DDB1- and CUL4-associated factor 8-like n=1 Tax=Acanthaster planci TaxID=133434 RepID=A0A8B7Y0J8_ACAPL|nr:DDB1- and CUL4-associated factor 8-like [Acanthaster planci]